MLSVDRCELWLDSKAFSNPLEFIFILHSIIIISLLFFILGPAQKTISG